MLGSNQSYYFNKKLEFWYLSSQNSDYKADSYNELTNHLGNALSIVSDRVLYKQGDDYDPYNKYNDSEKKCSVLGDKISIYPDVLDYNDYYPFGSTFEDASKTALANDYRYGFNGQEKVDEISGSGNHNTATFWEYDTRLGRRWNIDPVVKSDVSGYACFGNSPILFVDPNGDDWYKNSSYDPKKEGSKEYEWFKGSDKRDGYEHLGAYLVTADKEKNTLNFVYQNYEWTDKIDLNSDIGAKFRIVAGESNFIDHDGDGTADRSPLVDLFIISAMVDNRVASSAFPNTNKEVIEEGGGKQFNAANSPTYKNLMGQLGNWNKWYGEGQVMQYLGDVHFATAHSPSSSRGAVKMLTTKFQMVNADKLLAYNHNVANYKSFGSKTVFLTLPSGSWMKTINTSGWLYPDLLKAQEDAKQKAAEQPKK